MAQGVALEAHAVAFQMSFLEIAVWICADKLDLRVPLPHPTKKMHWVTGWIHVPFHRHKRVDLCSANCPELFRDNF